MAEQKGTEFAVSHSDEGASSQNVIKKSKKENEAPIDSDKSPHHQEETHGKSDDIDESTPVDEVKGPSVFQRAKEEVEAIVGSVLPKK
ncbi:hypothetical protein ABFS83_04G094000 [Erythranthe nasuta]